MSTHIIVLPVALATGRIVDTRRLDSVQQRAQGEAVVPARAKVSHLDVYVRAQTLRHPAQQCRTTRAAARLIAHEMRPDIVVLGAFFAAKPCAL